MRKYIKNIQTYLNENRFDKRNDEQYKNCYFSDLMRMDIIDDFLKNVKTDPNHNKNEPNYFKLMIKHIYKI